jgi:segregation and condensation protein A
MAGSANPNARLDGAAGEPESHAGTPGDGPSVAANGSPPAAPMNDWPEAGRPSTQGREGRTPALILAGFSGPLDHLLTLARAQKIALSDISLTALVDQLTEALRQAPASVPLGQKADWVVMAAWLVQLRTLLLLPADASARQDAEVEAGQLRERLVALQETEALAIWLAQRPQLGHDVFARGCPEFFGVAVETGAAIDVIEFLWASLALFDEPEGPATPTVYRPRPFELYAVAEARDRIRRRLAEAPDGAPLDRFLPDPPEMPESEMHETLRRRSAWSSTLIAGLELARQGEVVLGQGGDFEPIHVAPTCAHSPP